MNSMYFDRVMDVLVCVLVVAVMLNPIAYLVRRAIDTFKGKGGL